MSKEMDARISDFVDETFNDEWSPNELDVILEAFQSFIEKIGYHDMYEALKEMYKEFWYFHNQMSNARQIAALDKMKSALLKANPTI